MINGFVSWLMSPAASIVMGSLWHKLIMVVAGAGAGYLVHERYHDWKYTLAAGAGAAYAVSLVMNAAQVFSSAHPALGAPATPALLPAATSMAPNLLQSAQNVVTTAIQAPQNIPSMVMNTAGAVSENIQSMIPKQPLENSEGSLDKKYSDDDSGDQGIFGNI